MQFGAGLFMQVRNVLEHMVRGEIQPSEALEYIAAFGMLARCFDESTLATSEQPTETEPS
jgi:hypothetical protein